MKRPQYILKNTGLRRGFPIFGGSTWDGEEFPLAALSGPIWNPDPVRMSPLWWWPWPQVRSLSPWDWETLERTGNEGPRGWPALSTPLSWWIGTSSVKSAGDASEILQANTLLGCQVQGLHNTLARLPKQPWKPLTCRGKQTDSAPGSISMASG